MIDSLSSPLKWEGSPLKTNLPLIKSMPYRISQRDELAQSLSFSQLFSLRDCEVDGQQQRAYRWKALRQLHLVSTQQGYSKHSLVQALHRLPSYRVTMEHFVQAVMAEFHFDKALKMEAHLKWLFWSFADRRQPQQLQEEEEVVVDGRVDWRDILAAYQVLAFFRWVRERTADLFLQLTDIFSEGLPQGEQVGVGRVVHREDFLITKPCDLLRRLAVLVCQSDGELLGMETFSEELSGRLAREGFAKAMRRRELARWLAKGGAQCAQFLSQWGNLAWQRLSSDQRLTILDESQLYHKSQAEVIINKHKLSQALLLYHNHLLRAVVRGWRSATIRATGARIFLLRKNFRKKRRSFRFWLQLSRYGGIRRRRRALADVMAAYSLKARCFQRIKIHNANVKKIEKVVGSLHRKARLFNLFGGHLRQFYRLQILKNYYHRWWNLCVEENNEEVAAYHCRVRLFKMVLLPWARVAHEAVLLERQEMLARANKIAFDRRMEETEKAFAELLQLEAQRDERLAKERLALEEEERQRKLEEYRARVKMEKYTEKCLIESIQREARSKRIEKEMKSMKKRFKKQWEHNEKDLLLKAKERVTVYLENKENLPAFEMKFQSVKRDFFAYPTPETKERERTLASYRNILFLYIEARIKYDGLTVDKIIEDYDHLKKGYLSFAEFTKFIRSINTCLNEAQITSAIRSTDRSKDKAVSSEEIQHGLDHIQGRMGVLGSPWKIYIDPTEDVICYHHFGTNEKVLEYQMTDDILRRIVKDDMYGNAEYQANNDLEKQKEEAWEMILKNYMAKRLQFLYRYWKGRQYRKKKAWKIAKRIQKGISRYQKFCARFVLKAFIGRKARAVFKKQLHLTIERVYDASSGFVFYYNHQLGVSTWEPPLLLRRYGEVTAPSVWVPLDSTTSDVVDQQEEGRREGVGPSPSNESDGNVFDEHALVPTAIITTTTTSTTITTAIGEGGSKTGYWHIKARRALPFKPDGFILCNQCNYLLAVHTCIQCNTVDLGDGRMSGGHFCFACHRATHSHPMNFCQRTKATKQQYSHPDFIAKYQNFKHEWIHTEPYRCDVCKQSRLNAAFLCQTCGNKKICRTCFHRIHAHDSAHGHNYYNI